MPKRINNDTLIADLRAVADKTGKTTITADEYRELGAFSTKPAMRAFGSWNQALVRAGLSIGRKGNIRAGKRVNLHLRHAVLKRDCFRCVQCGASPARDVQVVLHVDHIVPVAKGGRAVIENLQTLCSLCNFGKSDELAC